MERKWKRPESVPYPSIWRRFDGRKEINEKIPKFWIQDVPDEMFDETVEIMCENFIYEEPMFKYLNIAYEPEALQEVRAAWRTNAEDKLGLICFMENPDPAGKPIVTGLNMTFVCEKDGKKPEPKSKQIRIIKDTVELATRNIDIFEYLGVTEYLYAYGLSVVPKFRGQNIGFELLEARTDLCKAVGLKATLSLFTAANSQKLAERSGFKDVISMSYEEIEKLNPNLRYPGISAESKYFKYMYKLM